MNQHTFDSADETPEHLAAECLSELRGSSPYPRDRVAQLARLATSVDEQAARQATNAIFAALVEPLSDSFDPRDVALYNRVFSQLIQVCRSVKEGRELDRELNGCGLTSEEKLLARLEHLTAGKAVIERGARGMKRVIVLSRVTLGADVAISSVIIERMKRRFPDSEIVLVGGRKISELFGGDPILSFQEVDYQRGGTFVERLASWTSLLDSVGSLVSKLERDEYLIVDTDTRLTQLGLLPVLRGKDSEPASLFFPSREYGSVTQRSLAELTSEWLDSVFGESQPSLPHVTLKRADIDAAEAIARLLRGARRPIVSMNFGVGENPGKSIGTWYEAALVSSVIERGATIILDRGSGASEGQRVDAVVGYLKDRQVRVVEVNPANISELLGQEAMEVDLLVFSGGIGLLAALIAESDLYIGYDSAGQHIAAALGVPCIDVMAGYSSERMPHRWRPTGPAEVRVVPVGGSVLEDSMAHVGEMLKKIEK